LFSSLNVATDTIQKDPETVQKFLNGLTKAYRYGAAHPDEFALVAKKWFPSADPDVIKRAVDTMIQEKSFAPSTVVRKADFEKNQEYFGMAFPDSPALKIKWNDVADTTFAERATKLAER
jgi:ABC-type nitrate/sulfonate/bicarbonate transport system substrate-binding protein